MNNPLSLYELLAYLRNFFPGLKWNFQNFEITGGKMKLPGMNAGGYYLIEGSRRNNGTHVYGDADLMPETFTGTVTEICLPRQVEQLWAEINEWIKKNAETLASPFQSESFGGYSYTKASTGGVDGGASWKNVFAPRLRQWRKL